MSTPGGPGPYGSFGERPADDSQGPYGAPGGQAPYGDPAASYGYGQAPYGQPYDPHAPYGQPPHAYGYYQPGYGGHLPQPGTNGLAIASMILGIVWIYWLGSLLAVIFGHIALAQTARTGQEGRGMAIAGVVLGWVGMAVLAVVIVALIVDSGHDHGYSDYLGLLVGGSGVR
ncbi:hypothetical protein B4N89_11270 [Embleya scabrispora]|uniref:DUF4190 domain-containing protein n=1 Tax=Embleya scabrispora TaxID=159449 RepID=A0A1T3NX91_9ACTN|nr:DUF4190 domain-containing protein [Embleya scabrispora]OPC81453.1 hypothetical protein B4N89_11270 [Embleya scabrispora]